MNSRKSKAKFTTRLLPIGVQTFDYCFAEEKISSLISWVKKHVMGIQMLLQGVKRESTQFFFFFYRISKFGHYPCQDKQCGNACMTN